MTTRSTASPTDSPTTGLQPAGPALASAIGRLAGETGSVARRTAVGLPELAPVQANSIKPMEDHRDPADGLPPQLASSLGSRAWIDRIDPEYGWDGRVSDYRLDRPINPAATAEVETWVAAVRETCRPLRRQDIAKELLRLSMLVARKAEDAKEIELRIEVFIDELKPYPADIVLDVLRGWPRRSRWFPTWLELQDQLGLRTRSRAALLRGLEEIARRTRAQRTAA